MKGATMTEFEDIKFNSMTEKQARDWERVCYLVKQGAKRSGIDLNKIAIVPVETGKTKPKRGMIGDERKRKVCKL